MTSSPRGGHRVRQTGVERPVRDQHRGCGPGEAAGEFAPAAAGGQHAGQAVNQSDGRVRRGTGTRFRDLPIRQKLLLMTFASSAVALLFASSGFLVWDVYQFSVEMRQDIAAQARIVGEAAAPAVEFNDDMIAEETLAPLSLRPHVMLGCLYKPNGALFADYRRDPTNRCPASPPLDTRMDRNRYDVVTPLRSGGDVVGTFFIRRDLDDL